MGRLENPVQTGIFNRINKTLFSRLFRNNVGLATFGNRKVKYGVCNPGGSDLIGWHSIEITQEMVGDRVAIFLAVETKKPKGKATDDQKTFLRNVNEAGGIGIKADKLADVRHLFE